MLATDDKAMRKRQKYHTDHSTQTATAVKGHFFKETTILCKQWHWRARTPSKTGLWNSLEQTNYCFGAILNHIKFNTGTIFSRPI